VLYAVPDDVAARFDCERRLQPGTASKAQRVYGNYFGSVFHAAGAKGRTVALLWGKEKGYWKVVGWQTDADEEEKLPAPAAPRVEVTRVAADASLAEAARGFLDQWLVRKNYDAAFAFLAPESYGCYNASRNPGAPAAPSVEAAGPLIRAGLERAGKAAGAVAQLATVVAAAEPVHPAVRVMDHPASRTFTLVGYPDDVNVAAGCAGAVDRSRVEAAGELKYGTVFGMNVRFVTAAGEGPVMRTLWAQGPGGWRITAYFIEYP
jgi:hypothetical protein